MSEPLSKVIVSQTGDATVAEIVGAIDISSAPELRAALTDAINAATTTAVVIDLRGVTFLGSPGLTALIAANTQAAARGIQLGVITGDNRIVLRPLQITGLDMSMPVRETLADLEPALGDKVRESERPG